MSLLLFLFAIIFLLILSFLLVVFRGMGLLFRSRNSNRTGRSDGNQKSSRTSFFRKEKPNKVFSENEGEYVEFEEVDDTK
ncbi:hypothetical protein D0T49_08100 [Paludibacter sp. 221]|nr:hypothetical protein [Paludibacter sp. 221]